MEAPSADLPAAHSMDTEWFAIDGRGHVAVFYSGEAGGLPGAHVPVWDAYSTWEHLLDELWRHASPVGLQYCAEGLFEDSERVRTQPPFGDRNPFVTDALLEFAAPREQAELEAQLGSAYVLASDPRFVYARKCLPRNKLEAAWYELGIVRAVLGPPVPPERFGIYSYECPDGSSGLPYERTATPCGAPLRAESLATGLRRRLAQVHLVDVDFSKDTAVQPFEHVPSSVWGSTWIGTDGTVHTVR